MTHRNNSNAIEAAMEILSDAGFDGFAEAFRILLNESMKAERSAALGAGLHERSSANLFPNEESLLRLVTAVVMEISDDWESGRIYLTMTEKNRRSILARTEKTEELVLE